MVDHATKGVEKQAGTQPPPLSLDDLAVIRAKYPQGSGLILEDNMRFWSEEQAIQFFRSGGSMRPVRGDFPGPSGRGDFPGPSGSASTVAQHAADVFNLPTAVSYAMPRPRWPPRAVWAGMHAATLAMLALSQGLPTNGTLVGWIFDVSLVLTLLLYAAASFRDPGYAPMPAPDALARKPTLSESLLPSFECLHCGADVSPRTKHCHDCCRCVRRMDHHCWWLGNCVGERTHCSFVLYLCAQTVLIVTCCALSMGSIGRLVSGAASAVPTPLALICAVLCTLLCLLAGFAACTLLAFQLALVLRGETTWERLKRQQLNAAAQLPPDERPYDRGVLRNVLIFCGCARDPHVPKWAEEQEWQPAVSMPTQGYTPADPTI